MWKDFDLDKGVMYVSKSVQWATNDGSGNQGRIKEPKTKNGIREISLSKYVLPYLLEADKSKPYLIHGLRAPAKSGTCPPSFSTIEGVINRIREACRECGITVKYESHEIRHTVITFDCIAEIDDKTLANNHGHYSAAFTKKQYARSLPSQRERARKISDDFIDSIL